MKAFSITDKGCRRPTNQDAYATEIMEERGIALLIVCDGMGGANAGNVASRFAVDTFLEHMKESLTDDMTREAITDALRAATNAANQTVYSLAHRQPEFSGMGTTLIAAVITEKLAMLANIGDSRAYAIDLKQIHQLTEDHSYVNEMVRQGRLSPAEAKTHPKRNLITRAVGVDASVETDVYEVDLRQGDVLLLCSDGLYGMVPDEEIADLIRTAPSMEEAGQSLIRQACTYGGTDNITAVLFTRKG